MRRILFVALLAMLILGALPLLSVNASPSPQFAGCADEVDREHGLRFVMRNLNGMTMRVTAIGVDGFNPTITVLDNEDEIVTCNANSEEASQVAVDLPTVTTEAPNEGAARASVNVPGDEGRLDYEVIVSGEDYSSGQFVFLYSGAEVFGSDNIDRVSIFPSQSMADAEVPLNMYVLNLSGGESAVDPALTFSFGENFEQYCGKSSSESLCDGDHEDLTGYTVTLDEETTRELNGNDVMLRFNVGGEAGEFTARIGSYNAATFGPYTMVVHSALAYPEDLGGDMSGDDMGEEDTEDEEDTGAEG
ncbi:MAG: hypothetical protein ACLFTK_02180 [Anaerolineales bacterium]